MPNISRKKQFKVAQISIVAVIFVAGLSLVFAMLDMHFAWIAFSVLVGTFVYTLLQSRLGASLIYKDRVKSNYFLSMLPLGSLCAVLLSLFFAFLGYTNIGGFLGFTIFALTNIAKLKYLFNFIVKKLKAT